MLGLKHLLLLFWRAEPVIAPVVYNAVYDLSTRTPWLPTGTVWYLIALVGGLLPELLHRSMATEEMLPSAK